MGLNVPVLCLILLICQRVVAQHLRLEELKPQLLFHGNEHTAHRDSAALRHNRVFYIDLMAR